MTQTNKKDKKENTQSNINYKGKVSLKVISKNKTLKKFKLNNEGEENLFKGICLYLIGNYNASDYVPYEVDLIDKDGNTVLIKPSILQAPSYSYTPEDTIKYYYASFNTTLFYNQILDATNIKWSELKLYLKDKKGDELANITYPSDAILSEGLAVAIQWQLYVYDASSSGPSIIKEESEE